VALQLDRPIATPFPGDEYAAGLPRNRPPAYLDGPPVKGFDRSPNYIRHMGDDTPIQAYSLREDYETNAEWYPTKTTRDWKTVNRNNESSRNNVHPTPTSPSKVGTRRIPQATEHHWGSTTDPREFDRSRG
jgi:hypothetical protein